MLSTVCTTLALWSHMCVSTSVDAALGHTLFYSPVFQLLFTDCFFFFSKRRFWIYTLALIVVLQQQSDIITVKIYQRLLACPICTACCCSTGYKYSYTLFDHYQIPAQCHYECFCALSLLVYLTD